MKNQIFESVIDGYTSEGLGVCRYAGHAVFVPKTIVGEVWRIRIVKVTKSAVYGKPEALLVPSRFRVEPDCPVFGKCGGCSTRHMSYEEELRFKLQRVNDALTRIGKQNFTVERIIGSQTTDRYRNKGIFTFCDIDGIPEFGFYRERTHDLIKTDRCLLQDHFTESAASALRVFMIENHIPSYDESSGKGVVRHIFCRSAKYTTDAIICIIAARGFGDKTAALVDHLRRSCPRATGIVLNINKSTGNTVLSGEFYTLWGEEYIRDTLNGLTFKISPKSFYQINPPQAEVLYKLAVDYALPENGGVALDLYCGTGTITLCMAKKARKVYGAEIVQDAIINAYANAQANNISNAEFICSDAGEAAIYFASLGISPDVVVVDPPRKGMDEHTMEVISSMHPERIVYVSCNPSTLARDVLFLSSNNYVLRNATAVDMFPRTHHVETVCLLTHN